MALRQSEEFSNIDPTSYLSLAQNLAQEKESASMRSAGDRAYYAAFLATRDDLEEKRYRVPPFPRSARAHDLVVTHLTRLEDEGLVTPGVGGKLRQLHLARNGVTYNTENTDQILARRSIPAHSGLVLQWMLATSEEVIDAVKNLPPLP